MMSEIKPCPFCGGKAKIKVAPSKRAFTRKNYFYVKCTVCSSTSRVEYTEEEAAEAWNHRTGGANDD